MSWYSQNVKKKKKTTHHLPPRADHRYSTFFTITGDSLLCKCNPSKRCFKRNPTAFLLGNSSGWFLTRPWLLMYPCCFFLWVWSRTEHVKHQYGVLPSTMVSSEMLRNSTFRQCDKEALVPPTNTSSFFNDAVFKLAWFFYCIDLFNYLYSSCSPYAGNMQCRLLELLCYWCIWHTHIQSTCLIMHTVSQYKKKKHIHLLIEVHLHLLLWSDDVTVALRSLYLQHRERKNAKHVMFF